MATVPNFVIQPYGRRGSRIAALAPIRTPDVDYAKRRSQQLAWADGNCGAAVIAETIDDAGELTGEPVVLAPFRTTPDEP